MIFPPSFQLSTALRLPKEKAVPLYLTALLGATHFPLHFSNWAFNLLMPKVVSITPNCPGVLLPVLLRFIKSHSFLSS